MWLRIRTILLRPQTIVVLALLFLVADALLAIFSPASAAADPDGLHPTTLPGTETLLEAPHDDDDWLLPAKTYAGNRYTGLVQIDKANVGTLRMAWETSLADDGEQEAAPLIWRLWDWQTIPGPGQPGHETWPGESWRHGGGAVWSGLALDQANDGTICAPKTLVFR
jgi:glucose dehydrogenase